MLHFKHQPTLLYLWSRVAGGCIWSAVDCTCGQDQWKVLHHLSAPIPTGLVSSIDAMHRQDDAGEQKQHQLLHAVALLGEALWKRCIVYPVVACSTR